MITLTNPIQVPSIPTGDFNLASIKTFNYNMGDPSSVDSAGKPNRPSSATATFIFYQQADPSSPAIYADPRIVPPKTVTRSDIAALAATDPEIAAAMAALEVAMQKYLNEDMAAKANAESKLKLMREKQKVLMTTQSHPTIAKPAAPKPAAPVAPKPIVVNK